MATTYTARGLPVQPWPTFLKPAEISLNPRANTSVFSSPFTRTTQTVSLPGALWMLEASFPPLRDPTKVGELRAWSARLSGRAGRFLFPAYTCRYAPPLAGEPERQTWFSLTADNADGYITSDNVEITADATRMQMETTFVVSEAVGTTQLVGTLLFNSRRYPLTIGSYIAWDDDDDWRHLHMVVGMEYDPVTHEATLDLEPPMRAVPTPETPIHVHAPAGIFQLTEDAAADLRQAGRLVSFTISAVQSFPLEVTA